METRALAKKQYKDRDGSFLLLLQVINHQRITSLIKKYREYPSQCRIREKTLCLVWDKPWRGRGLQEKQGSQAWLFSNTQFKPQAAPWLDRIRSDPFHWISFVGFQRAISCLKVMLEKCCHRWGRFQATLAPEARRKLGSSLATGPSWRPGESTISSPIEILRLWQSSLTVLHEAQVTQCYCTSMPSLRPWWRDT